MSHAASVHDHAHHFKSKAHEFDTCKNGMWLFLLQEVLFFSPLFVGYALFRGLYPDSWAIASKELDWKMGTINTFVLLLSSFTMASAVTAAQLGKLKALKINLWITLLCGFGFLFVKYLEYSHKIHAGLLPAGLFSAEHLKEVPHAPLYFSLYFIMTGLHGLHVVGGMVVLLWIIKRAHAQEFGPGNFTAVEVFGLYWHFVDLVWIYLFPLLYLV